MDRDPDYDWLLGHLDGLQSLRRRDELAQKVGRFLKTQIESGRLPYTVGVFGGWGSGKTTFLALVARQLEAQPNCRIIYFNSWKYAGFMEIVPSLIYKILRYGVAQTHQDRNKAAMRIMLSLGKEYSDRFGEWAEKRVGVNPVNLFKDAYQLSVAVKDGERYVMPEVLEAYYTQVDKAQDVLKEVLGTVGAGTRPQNAVIVLIDELDRCDPDEAFNVIKQMRVLFAMRSLPVAFVVCANPEPIGLAIKHRYGLESDDGDYEARRILEKFVDSYEDLSEPAGLASLVRTIWKEAAHAQPWVLAVDDDNGDVDYNEDVVKNATALDAITTAVPLYSNLRVLQKSFKYVNERAEVNRRLLWTIWHLAIANQVDPRFRRDLRMLAAQIEQIARASYGSLAEVSFEVKRTSAGRQLNYRTDKGRTLFSIFRSCFWDHAKTELENLGAASDPESSRRASLLKGLLGDSRRVDFVILLCMLPFRTAPSHTTLLAGRSGDKLPSLLHELDGGLQGQFGWLIANY